MLGACSQYSTVKKLPLSALTTTGEQKALYRSLKPLGKYPRAQIGRYLDSADEARRQLATKPDDPAARENYNFAVARIVGIINRENLAPWEAPVVCASGEANPWNLSIKPSNPRQKDNLPQYEILPADRLDFKGKLVGEHKLKEGLGAPVVAVAKGVDFKQVRKPAEGGKLRFYGLTAIVRFKGRVAELELIDPLATEGIEFEGQSYPLAADFQAPLALALSKLQMKKKEISGMFSPGKYADNARLALLQPYDAAKTPVLFIHGLGNSAATWAPMVDQLRNNATIRKRYQFWMFNYPTGLPYPKNAATLNAQLDEIKRLHPHHKDIVIVAHSLGGNITRLLITDSGMKLWDTVFDKPPADIPFSDKTRELMSDALIFKARPDISRVIFASASLRGSETATGFIGRMGAKLIGNPFAEKLGTEEALTYARPEVKALGKKHLPNSVEILNPDSLFLKSVNALPIKPGIPYHTLIGDRGKGGNPDHTEPVSTDGIVPYWSSHLDGAVSERIIPSDHWSILHPDGIAEVERILLEY